MVKSIKNLIKMIPDYKEIRVYSGLFRKSLPVTAEHLAEVLAAESPFKFINIDTAGELLLIGHPDTED